jgi:hypothetical protein
VVVFTDGTNEIVFRLQPACVYLRAMTCMKYVSNMVVMLCDPQKGAY